MKLGFTGTQQGMTDFQLSEYVKLLEQLDPDTLLHGDCIGSDAQAHIAFLLYHIKNDTKDRSIIFYLPEKENKRAFLNETEFYSPQLKDELAACKHSVEFIVREPYPYLERNRHIAEDCDILVATPKEYEHTLRSGTWATIRHGWHKSKQVIVIPPDAEVSEVVNS